MDVEFRDATQTGMPSQYCVAAARAERKLPDGRRWHGWGEPRLVDARVVERCAFCDFTVAAPAAEAREAFAQHVCDRPKPKTSIRRRRGFAIRPRA